MQNPSDFTTRATRKTTRFGVRDAKCKRRTAPCTEPAWALQNSKAIGQMCKKPWENQDSRKLKVERSCGQDRNRTTYKFPGKLALRHHARHEIRRAPISLFCDDSKHYPSRPTCNCFTARFTGSRIQDRSKFTGSWFSVCRVIYRVTSKTPENLQGHNFDLRGQANNDTDRFQFGSSTCPPPANGGFRMDSGQRGSRSR